MFSTKTNSYSDTGHVSQAPQRPLQSPEAVGRLAAEMAHDFNNMLTPILGNLTLAREDQDMSPATRELIEEALSACARAKELSDQLLTFSSGGVPMRSLCSPARIITECAGLHLQGPGIRGKVALADGLWSLLADSEQISQALRHLVVNAVQALGSRGGEVRLRAFNQVENGQDFLRIEVADDGPGIDAENLDQIFAPFFSTWGGRGIGLTCVDSITQRHGGRVTVFSPPGGGARFQLVLPASREVTSTPLSVPLAGRRFLLVDDDSSVRRVLRRGLERMGAMVEEAGDGRLATRLYKEARLAGQPFDLAVLDQTIRGGPGGAEILDELRRIDPDVVAVVASGYFSETLANYRDWGFRAAIRKPFSLEDVRRTLQEVLGSRSADGTVSRL